MTERGRVGAGVGAGARAGRARLLMDLATSLSLSLAVPTHIARTLTNSAATPPCAGCEVSLFEGCWGSGKGSPAARCLRDELLEAVDVILP